MSQSSVGYNNAVGNNATPLDAHRVAKYFQRCLNEAGNPIEFTKESGLPRQRAQAKRLLIACGYRHQEVVAIIKEYCKESWWVENQPDLAQVIKQADDMRARIAVRQQQQQEESWADFEEWRATL